MGWVMRMKLDKTMLDPGSHPSNSQHASEAHGSYP